MRLQWIVAPIASLLCVLTASAWADGDPVKGEAVYRRCMSCHDLDRTVVGPPHRGLFGRRAGSVDGYMYSNAMRGSGIVWTQATLDRFLENPRAVVPGTRMAFVGVKNPQERADLIAYLQVATSLGD